MGYIFETEIEQIKHVVRARTIGEAESITLREILASRIHPAIKAYFKAEVYRNLQEERQLETRSKKFPYSIPEVVSLQQQEDLLLMVHYQFNQHEFDTLLDQAVHFTFNFLCRPQFTLVEFLFENQRRMSVTSIERKLTYCADYEYYSVLLRRYFAERGLTEISFEEFKMLLRKIDAEVVSRHSSRELADMTKAIIGFVEAVQDGARAAEWPRTLPINAAIVFFEDKELEEVKLRLEYERDHNKLTNIDVSKLAEIIDDVRSITSGNAPTRVVAEITREESEESKREPIKVEIQRESSDEPEPERPAEPLVEAPEMPTAPDVEPEAGQVTVQSPASVDANLPGIESLFSPSEAKKVLKRIFHKDKDDYAATLQALDRAGSWEEASLILDDLFLAREVSPQSAVAILMTEKTYERYRPGTNEKR